MAAIPIRSWLPLAAITAGVVAACVCRSAREHPHGVQLCGPSPDIAARIEAKNRLAREVLAGRLSLPEAAAAFKALDAAGPAKARRCPSTTLDDEGLCRKVISWVEAIAPPGEGEEAACRLEAELDERVRQDTLRLPDP